VLVNCTKEKVKKSETALFRHLLTVQKRKLKNKLLRRNKIRIKRNKNPVNNNCTNPSNAYLLPF